MRLKTVLVLLLSLFVSVCFGETINTDIYINTTVTVNTFKPYNIFGNNVNGWTSPVPFKEKIQAAGNFILRYPGGSWGDAVFWNGSGSYDASGNWVASETEYSNSRIMKDNGMLYDSSKIIDGKDETLWQSNADTDFPKAQWIYVDFKNKKVPDKVAITWGDGKKFPYAKKFTVQYWDPKNPRTWMVYGADDNGWIDTSAKNIKGKAGVQEISFEPVEAQYVRILMTESSAGPKGTYSVASIKAYEEGAELEIKDNNSVVSSSCNTACELGDRPIFGFEDYMTFMQSFEPKAEPLIIVNVGSGTPALAAAWVKYANVTKKYGIKYWEIGNENGGQWEAGGPMNVYDYTRRFIKYYEAMKAVDPAITIIAQGQADGVSQAQDKVPHIKAMADRLAKEKKVHYLAGGIVTHQYLIWGQTVETVLAAPEKNFEDMEKSIKEQLAAYPELANVPVWITEFNMEFNLKSRNATTHLDNGLFLTSYLGEFIKHFGSRGYTMMWDAYNGGNAITDPKGGDHGYLQAEDGEYKGQERATYWAMKMLTNYWSKSGDKEDHKLVETASGVKLLSAYTNLKPDNTLSMIVVNKDPKNEYRTTVNISGYKPANEGRVYSFDKDNYQWKTDNLPYHADPSKAPSEWNIGNVSEKFEYTFRPYSITVINMKAK